MYNRTDVIYLYDGSFEGLLCCVFEAYDKKENPADILSTNAAQSLFQETKWIETDSQKAQRVNSGICKNISLEAQELVRLGFLTCTPHKEMLILGFLRLGFVHKSKVLNMITDETVFSLQKAVRHLLKESHLFKGFVRFSVHGKALVAVIEPKNFVLPLLSEHFCNRYPNEAFMIFDKTNSVALVYRPKEAVLIPMQELVLPDIDEKEAEYRRLWKQFYDTIAIESRYNPRCRMTLMPKRYWKNMLEVQDELKGEKRLKQNLLLQLEQSKQ